MACNSPAWCTLMTATHTPPPHAAWKAAARELATWVSVLAGSDAQNNMLGERVGFVRFMYPPPHKNCTTRENVYRGRRLPSMKCQGGQGGCVCWRVHLQLRYVICARHPHLYFSLPTLTTPRRPGPVGKSRWIELDPRLSRRLAARVADGTEYKHVFFSVARGAQPFLRLGRTGEIGFILAVMLVCASA